MKSTAIFVTSLAAVSAFAPTPAGRTSTQINESLFDKVRSFAVDAPLCSRETPDKCMSLSSPNVAVLLNSLTLLLLASTFSDLPNGLVGASQGFERLRSPQQEAGKLNLCPT
jgi:hypothetical protein